MPKSLHHCCRICCSLDAKITALVIAENTALLDAVNRTLRRGHREPFQRQQSHPRCARHCCSPLPENETYQMPRVSGTIHPIREYQTNDDSRLRRKFAFVQCEICTGPFVGGHSLRATVLVECKTRKEVCCGDSSPQAAIRLLARSNVSSMSAAPPQKRQRRHSPPS